VGAEASAIPLHTLGYDSAYEGQADDEGGDVIRPGYAGRDYLR